jgi:hypothetical protein
MPAPNGRQALIDHRRRLVASLILRKRTQREIVNALHDQGLRNPDTDNAYSLYTINQDVKALRKQWREDAEKDYAEAVTDHLAELGEVRRSAWGSLDYGNILRALGQEADIRGINSPTEIKHSGGVEIGNSSDADLVKAAKEVVAIREADASTPD